MDHQTTALLASSFRKVLYIKPGTLFFNNPQRLFDSMSFKKDGVLLFPEYRIAPVHQVFSEFGTIQLESGLVDAILIDKSVHADAVFLSTILSHEETFVYSNQAIWLSLFLLKKPFQFYSSGIFIALV